MKKGRLLVSLSLALLFGLGIVLGLGVAFYWNFKTKKETIKIGMPTALTGENASYGRHVRRALNIAVDKVNAAGGVLGRRVELLIEDDVCLPEVAMNVVSKLLAENIVAAVGHVCSSSVDAVLGLYQDKKVLVISPSASNPTLVEGNDVFFRTIVSDNAQAEKGAFFVLNTLKPKKIAIFHDRDTYGRGLAELFRDLVEQDDHTEVVLFTGISPQRIDYSLPVRQIAESGAELVFWGGYLEPAAKLLRQLAKEGVDVEFMSGEAIKLDSFIDLAGEAAEGIYATGPADVSKNPMAIRAAQEHVERYGEEPGTFYNEAYSAFLALINAIKRAQTTEFEAVRSALVGSKVETPIGDIGFSVEGEFIGPGMSVYRVENGKFVEYLK